MPVDGETLRHDRTGDGEHARVDVDTGDDPGGSNVLRSESRHDSGAACDIEDTLASAEFARRDEIGCQRPANRGYEVRLRSSRARSRRAPRTTVPRALATVVRGFGATTVSTGDA
jgi:hypothetical protein